MLKHEKLKNIFKETLKHQLPKETDKQTSWKR